MAGGILPISLATGWRRPFCANQTRRNAPCGQTPDGLRELLATAPHDRTADQGRGGDLAYARHLVAADSGILSQPAAWLDRVGDAAMTYDPIASHGILMALVSARDAAKAIWLFYQGNTKALAQYDEVMSEAYYAYVKERQKFYR